MNIYKRKKYIYKSPLIFAITATTRRGETDQTDGWMAARERGKGAIGARNEKKKKVKEISIKKTHCKKSTQHQ